MTNEHYHFGLGRRKSAVARVRLYPGNGKVLVNGKPAGRSTDRATYYLETVVSPSTARERRAACSWTP